jgi:hypothetical protein
MDKRLRFNEKSMSRIKGEIYGAWTCPVCGDECMDPERIVNTVCHNLHRVTLGEVYNGDKRYHEREAFSRNETVEVV